MRVLRDLADQRAAIGLGHPVLRLDAHVRIDARLKSLLLRRHVFVAADLLQSRVDHLCVHARSPRRDFPPRA
jgi:hypothetical protein